MGQAQTIIPWSLVLSCAALLAAVLLSPPCFNKLSFYLCQTLFLGAGIALGSIPAGRALGWELTVLTGGVCAWAGQLQPSADTAAFLWTSGSHCFVKIHLFILCVTCWIQAWEQFECLSRFWWVGKSAPFCLSYQNVSKVPVQKSLHYIYLQEFKFQSSNSKWSKVVAHRAPFLDKPLIPFEITLHRVSCLANLCCLLISVSLFALLFLSLIHFSFLLNIFKTHFHVSVWENIC